MRLKEVRRIIESDEIMDLLVYAQCLLRSNDEYFTLRGRTLIDTELNMIMHEVIDLVAENGGHPIDKKIKR
ncbi:hypothetical protein SAMN02910406_03741 [Ruminococcus albus]|uniref:Uncharacterized protein n=1 Tax=Ruminococcus albus TaxID=1264 RepID=A0A1H7F2Z5_RUMAL|nr:hypothetical protein SAMN05216469_10185 [Ruminococcus albus]SFD35978.1 hypothetical protein SAMN02910406_03741 [Ruminococcus albus]